MVRLPTPGSDNGTWGDILNDFLLQTYHPDGQLKENIITSAQIADGTVVNASLEPAVQDKIDAAAPAADPVFTGSVTVPAPTSPTDAANKLYVDNTVAVGAPVTSVATRTGDIVLTKGDVGLGNVDNTSDASKPVSTATATALGLKAPLASPSFTGAMGHTGGAWSHSGGDFQISDGGVLDSTAVRVTSSGGNLYLQNGSGNNIVFRGKTAGVTANLDNSGNLAATGAVTGTQHISTIATGTAPLQVTSTTVVTNLNADLLDGSHGSSFFQNSDVVMNTNPFGGRQLYINSINNGFFRADKRWVVTGNFYNTSDDSLIRAANATELARLFNGNYEDDLLIPIGQYAIVNINFSTEPGGLYPGYPYGNFFLSHYFYNYSSAATLRVYCNYAPHGIGWHTINFTTFSDNGSTELITKARNDFYQISQMEFKISAPASGRDTWATQIEFQLDRPGGNEMPLLDKYKSNILYSNMTFENGANTTNLSLNSDGSAYFAGNVGVNNLSAAVALDVTGEARVSTAGTNANSVVTVGGAQTLTNKTFASITSTYANKTTAYTITTSDAYITADATGGAFNITLPTSVGKTGQVFSVKRINSGSNVVTVNTTSSQTIDGVTTWPLTSQNATIVVVSDGANWQLLQGYRNSVDVQSMIASGTTNASGTWTKPPGARVVQIVGMNGGGGGASGRRGAAGTVRCGGGGGGSSGTFMITIPASDLNATETLLAGGGGAGGAAVTTDDTNGNPGLPGVNSYIKSQPFCKQSSHTASVGGTNALGTGGTGWGNSLMGSGGGNGGSASATGGVGTAGGGGSGGASSAGGSGGGLTSGDVESAGGQANNQNGLVGGAAGTAGGGNGGTATAVGGTLSSVGGGGGGSSKTTAGGNGGNGATGGYGAGGGGGGASLNGFNSGAGGNGSPGYIIVTTYC